MPLMVPCVPTGMKTGVKTSPCGRLTVAALARPHVASKLKTKGGEATSASSFRFAMALERAAYQPQEGLLGAMRVVL